MVFTGSQLLHYSECPLLLACVPSLKGCVCMVDCLSVYLGLFRRGGEVIQYPGTSIRERPYEERKTQCSIK